MALPKEPRQKMVNMMYLVLTAMLALNVSSEILNAFKIVNHSIATSNDIISAKNNLTYASFEEKAKDPQTAAKANIWKPKADQARKISKEMYDHLENLKTTLKKEAGLKIVNGVESFKEDNLDATTRMMDNNGEGKKLYERLGNFKKEMLNILNPNDFAGEPLLQESVKKARASFEKSLPIDLTVPKSQTGTVLTNDAKGWTTNYFHMTPSIAGLTILSKFQNDVKNSESQLVDYCHEQIGAVKVVFDQFQAIAQANTTYAMPGDPIEITAGVGAFSAAAKPKIYINGQLQNIGSEGTALYKTTANGAGDHSVTVIIEYAKPDGSIAKVTKPVKYTVGAPSGVAVSADKMNVLYIGVDNPLTITAGVGAEKVNATFSGGTIKRVAGPKWIANPKTPGEHNINVIVDGKSSPVKYRVKYLPDPAAFIANKRGGSIPAGDIKAQGGLIARLVESDFEASFKVVSYSVGAVGGRYPVYQTSPNTGNRWSGGAATIINSATPGTSIFFDNIKVVGPDGRTRDLPQMSFNLK